MKKILLLSFEFPPYITGGIGTVALELSKSFAKLGCEVIVIAPFSKDYEYKGFNFNFIPIYGKNKFIRMQSMLHNAKKIIKKNNIDCIYSMTATYTGLVAFILSKLFKKPYYVMAHGNEFIRFKNNKYLIKLIRKIFNESEVVFSVSEFTKNLLNEINVKQDIYTCFNGVNLNEFSIINDKKLILENKFNINQNNFNLLTVSRLEKRKNHISVLKALDLIRKLHPDSFKCIKYYIAGKGDQEKLLINEIENLNLQETVYLLGYIHQDDLNLLYNCSDLFIMPNIITDSFESVEGFGLVFLEAGAAGLPSIGGISGGSAEAIVNETTGYCIDGSSISQISDTILRLYNDQSLLSDLSQKAREHSLNFSWEKISNKILSQIIIKD